MSKKLKFQSPTGMHDILPEEQKYLEKIFNTVKSAADFYQFQKIDTPILEQAELFLKGVGMSTDIVEKQMFLLRTKGGDTLALRPEGTAPVARAYIEHGMMNLPQPVKLWYLAPFFRYEHPQAGRFRQFWQFGFEVLGELSPALDAQVIQIFYNILKELKLKNLVVQVNSIGDSACRPYYKKILVSYFKTRVNSLCSDCRRRLKENPLRILDCKEEKCQRIVASSPQIIDHLCEPCHKHFKEVLEFLDEMGLPYHLNPYLVRGLDYYTKTVFEIVEESAEGKNLGTLSAGGRYDNLVKILGGKETPSVGGAAGLERIIEFMKKEPQRFPHPSPAQVFIAQLGTFAKRKCLKLIEEFRGEGIRVLESLGRDSLKAQLKIADKEGVLYTLILGQQEVLAKSIIIRDMKNGKQETVKLERAVAEIKKRLRR
ncbi:MAG: histidine--tRNA ligase [Candidatus Nealsonbacteria bacterium RIFCSPLOWO2_01_FULL_41_9]|uniref:Histidine--tRNA ligase n=1 Tax=Candidatus Nealsonbacteria bacterium RIFCSPLOWO2_01_FULL_41_9 TaxID=1801671 RepID=A0A1G2EDQ3_9BACT|nr:MAG: histidine--tRNA ligase [Candidatus Nealsonbacteria bacterium RIFCSPLOWO2_01_FULL_41_9]